MELMVRNVQEAYVRGLAALRKHGVWEDTRNGRAIVLPEPMVTVYGRPIERVLLDPARDANPFFHLLESIWMLAGRDDVASLLPFNQGLKQYSDDEVRYHGAYGKRWRGWFYEDLGEGSDQEPPIDQVRRAIELLRANPADRRVVIQMWDATTDLGREGKDFPCNTQLFFRARRVEGLSKSAYSGIAYGDNGPESELALDMTILNRSNDAVWGAYGANAVHFSVLQEFIAAASGMRVGRMIQFSNNFHAYEAVLDKVGEPAWPVIDCERHTRYHYVRSVPLAERIVTESDHYQAREVQPTPLFRVDRTTDLDDVFLAIDAVWDDTLDDDGHDHATLDGQFTEEGLNTILWFRSAYLCRRTAPEEAVLTIGQLPERSDWRRAAEEWLARRRKS